MYLVRSVGNWLNLSTPFGLAVAVAGRAHIQRGPRGLWYATGYRYRYPAAGAFTTGNVIVTAQPSFAVLEQQFPDILTHEEAHTWQFTYMGGLVYLPVYALAMGYSWLRTGDRASANFFERQADLAWGGYREQQRRPLRSGVTQLRTLVARRPGR